MKAFHVSNLLTLMPNPVHAQNMHFKTKLIAKKIYLKMYLKRKKGAFLLQFKNHASSIQLMRIYFTPIKFSIFAD